MKTSSPISTTSNSSTSTLLHLQFSISELFDLVTHEIFPRKSAREGGEEKQPQDFSHTQEHQNWGNLAGNMVFEITSLILDLMQELPTDSYTGNSPKATKKTRESSKSSDGIDGKGEKMMPPSYEISTSHTSIEKPRTTRKIQGEEAFRIPESMTVANRGKWMNLKYYHQYEATIGISTLHPTDKLIFNVLIGLILSALIYSISTYLSLKAFPPILLLPFGLVPKISKPAVLGLASLANPSVAENVAKGVGGWSRSVLEGVVGRWRRVSGSLRALGGIENVRFFLEVWGFFGVGVGQYWDF